MPIVKKHPRYVVVAYELMCGFERGTALANELYKLLKNDKGFYSAQDDTRGWDGDRMALIKVTYNSLKDAIRLDSFSRKILSQNVNFSYNPNYGTSYGGRGAHLTVNPITTCEKR